MLFSGVEDLEEKNMFYRQKGMLWFRIFGYGLAWKSIKLHKLLFSERNGYRGFKIGNWIFIFLKRNKL